MLATDNGLSITLPGGLPKIKAVALVGDTGRVMQGRGRARAMFAGDLFAEAVRYAECHERWYILSARYGLLDPDEFILGYEDNSYWMDAYQWHMWSQKVLKRLAEVALPETPFVCLAGGKYLCTLRRLNVSLLCPLAGMSPRQRGRWLRDSVADRQGPAVALPRKGGAAC